MHLSLADVVAALERRYPPSTAESWDAVGLVAGDPAAPVRKVLLAVDPVPEVVREALDWGADLLVTHHPLYLRGTSTVAADSPKGRMVHDLVRAGCALYAAHTNADAAEHGVAQALAERLGLHALRPLRPLPAAALDTLVTFVPQPATHTVLDALAAAGAGRLGDYERAAFTAPGTGTFRPLAGANPTIGAVGAVEEVTEDRLEIVLPRHRRDAVLQALRRAHPYEEPAFTLVEQAPTAAATGIGRVGELTAPMPLQELAEQVAAALPPTPAGIRVGGDPGATVRTVAVSGGAGDSLLGAARAAGADVFLTADLRHHPASEHLLDGPPHLIDATHWASEWPWLPRAAALLEEDTRGAGAAVQTRVSTHPTDPWTLQLGARSSDPGTDDEGAPL